MILQSQSLVVTASHEHLADLESLGDVTDDRVVQQVGVPVHDDGPRTLVSIVVGQPLVPERGAPEYIVGAIEREPAVGGGAEAGSVLRQARDPAEEGAAVAGGAEGSVREHDPRQLAHVVARAGRHSSVTWPNRLCRFCRQTDRVQPKIEAGGFCPNLPLPIIQKKTVGLCLILHLKFPPGKG
jgi:hypothetical protein